MNRTGDTFMKTTLFPRYTVHRSAGGLTDRRYIPANVLSGGSRSPTGSCILFSCETDFARGSRPGQQIGTFAENGQRRAITPAVILFIALPEAKDNIDPG